MQTKINQLMASPFGTWLKVFISVVLVTFLTQYTNSGEICLTKKCVTDLIMGGLISTLPVLMNWINPHYKNYGRQQ